MSKYFVYFLTLLLTFCDPSLSLRCYDCMSGYYASTSCSDILPEDIAIDCNDSPNSQCYEAQISYQNGAFNLVERRCWTPPSSQNTTDFCRSFNNPLGKLLSCKTCTTSLCNNSPIRNRTATLSCPYSD